MRERVGDRRVDGRVVARGVGVEREVVAEHRRQVLLVGDDLHLGPDEPAGELVDLLVVQLRIQLVDRSASRLCSRTNSVCTTVRPTCSLARTSPARNSAAPAPNWSALGSPAVFSGSSSRRRWSSACRPGTSAARRPGGVGAVDHRRVDVRRDAVDHLAALAVARRCPATNSERLNGIRVGPERVVRVDDRDAEVARRAVGQHVELRPRCGSGPCRA